jgi:hypothetical protein
MTIIAPYELDSDKTDQTDQTDDVSISHFLQSVFGSELGDKRPVVVSFKGSADNVSGSAWFGNSWKPGDHELSGTNNNYFTLATYNPDASNKYQRKKKSFNALHAIMLDDIGKKVALERLTLKPSWLIQTSKGNYQAGYILETPITDVALTRARARVNLPNWKALNRNIGVTWVTWVT